MTNAVLTGRSGTETLVRDTVLALRRRGHSVTAFAPITGPAVAEIRATGSPVATSLAALEAPDIIHGHHTGPTIAALTVVSKKVVQSLERADASKGRVWACQVVVGCPL
ncbi:hypothetical protein HNQ95_002226, partial [Aminobacter ciceronei]|nr:hypothetical protein [Aminobacter ciceronei]MBA9020231.1 hypothetical protein [Aminobacter ciceronei]